MCGSLGSLGSPGSTHPQARRATAHAALLKTVGSGSLPSEALSEELFAEYRSERTVERMSVFPLSETSFGIARLTVAHAYKQPMVMRPRAGVDSTLRRLQTAATHVSVGNCLALASAIAGAYALESQRAVSPLVNLPLAPLRFQKVHIEAKEAALCPRLLLCRLRWQHRVAMALMQDPEHLQRLSSEHATWRDLALPDASVNDAEVASYFYHLSHCVRFPGEDSTHCYLFSVRGDQFMRARLIQERAYFLRVTLGSDERLLLDRADDDEHVKTFLRAEVGALLGVRDWDQLNALSTFHEHSDANLESIERAVREARKADVQLHLLFPHSWRPSVPRWFEEVVSKIILQNAELKLTDHWWVEAMVTAVFEVDAGLNPVMNVDPWKAFEWLIVGSTATFASRAQVLLQLSRGNMMEQKEAWCRELLLFFVPVASAFAHTREEARAAWHSPDQAQLHMREHASSGAWLGTRFALAFEVGHLILHGELTLRALFENLPQFMTWVPGWDLTGGSMFAMWAIGMVRMTARGWIAKMDRAVAAQCRELLLELPGQSNDRSDAFNKCTDVEPGWGRVGMCMDREIKAYNAMLR